MHKSKGTCKPKAKSKNGKTLLRKGKGYKVEQLNNANKLQKGVKKKKKRTYLASNKKKKKTYA